MILVFLFSKIYFIGFKKEEFITILDSLTSLRETCKRNKSQALAIYLFWLKTGLDQQNIGTIFCLENQKSVSRLLAQVRKALIKDFVPIGLIDMDGFHKIHILQKFYAIFMIIS